MKKNPIIEFELKERILEKARKNVGLVDLFLEEGEKLFLCSSKP